MQYCSLTYSNTLKLIFFCCVTVVNNNRPQRVTRQDLTTLILYSYLNHATQTLFPLTYLAQSYFLLCIVYVTQCAKHKSSGCCCWLGSRHPLLFVSEPRTNEFRYTTVVVSVFIAPTDFDPSDSNVNMLILMLLVLRLLEAEHCSKVIYYET